MTKWKYANLDAIRGLAAILIVFRHAPLLFHSPSFPQSYLAVDLFFAISGFVVANAYEARLRSGALGFLAFAKLRLIRLYPLYLIAIVLGLASHFVAMAHLHQHGRPLPSLFATTLFVLLSLLMLPSRATPLYLVNNPAWSLFYEIVANLAFAAIVRRAVPRILVLAMIPCAIVMLRYALDHHGIDEGWDLGKWYLALARVGFSFSAGALLFRLRRGGPRPASAAVSLLALAAVLLMLCAKIPPRWAGPAAIAEVFVAIPLIVHAATSFEPPAWLAPAFETLGRVSYGLYILHVPVLLLAYRLLEPHRHAVYGKPALAAFVAGMLVLVALLDRYVDAPLRAWLSRPARRRLEVPIASRV
ncbi:acyltransferase family protein [Burkholderia gladioli]|uniref:acyltransferase family protein n=1 Tax=Burkholderia gladioli TaxID=28095 RepID=UPI00163E1FA9|nr:acyltransferase [Burkholderia gladioli]URV26978.1 acyltransferase [Burkholderia gladioli]